MISKSISNYSEMNRISISVTLIHAVFLNVIRLPLVQSFDRKSKIKIDRREIFRKETFPAATIRFTCNKSNKHTHKHDRLHAQQIRSTDNHWKHKGEWHFFVHLLRSDVRRR